MDSANPQPEDSPEDDTAEEQAADSGSEDTGSADTGTEDTGSEGGDTGLEGGDTSEPAPIDTSTLQGAAASSGRRVGVALSSSAYASDPDYLALLVEEFGGITPENATKWGPLQPTADSWDFSTADDMVSFALDNDLRVKGHTLLWHSQMPDWVDESMSAAELQSAVDSHVETTLLHFGSDVQDWDVVNEALEWDGSLRESLYLTKLGSDYIADAFLLASEFAPDARLFYNDYSIEGYNSKSDALIEIVADLLDAGVPIHGIGMQMHLTHDSAPSRVDIRGNMERMAALGILVHVSEMDVQIRHLQGPESERLLAQAMTYYDVAAACVEVAGCEQLSFWGFTDRYSWIDSWYGDDDPLLYDEDLMPKPAREAVHAALLGEPMAGCAESRLSNGDFEAGTDEWTTWGSTLDTVSEPVYEGSSASFSTERSEAWQGPVQPLLGVISTGHVYQGTGWVLLDNAASAEVKMTLHWNDDAGDHWTTVDMITASDSEWMELSGVVDFGSDRVTGAVTEASLYIEGPPSGVNFYADAVALHPVCPDTAVPISR